MKKNTLPKEIAEKFCYEYNWHPSKSFKYLRLENNKSKFLDLNSELLLETIISMEENINAFYESVSDKPTEEWICDVNELEYECYLVKIILIERFDNIQRMGLDLVVIEI